MEKDKIRKDPIPRELLAGVRRPSRKRGAAAGDVVAVRAEDVIAWTADETRVCVVTRDGGKFVGPRPAPAPTGGTGGGGGEAAGGSGAGEEA